MMCDTNWCTFCDNAINPYSDSLYCSEECLRQDALLHHPMLGYDYSDLKNFPHGVSNNTSAALQQQNHHKEMKFNNSETSSLPDLVRRKSSICSIYNNSKSSTSQVTTTKIIIPSLSPSLSSSISSYSSASSHTVDEACFLPSSYFHPKPQRIASSIPLIERLNQAIIGL